MSKADEKFVSMCRDILENGFSTEGNNVRARWDDGTPAHTIKNFGVVNRYDLSEEFPALTLRPTAIRLAFDELLWIGQMKTAALARPTDISWAFRTSSSREKWTR